MVLEARLQAAQPALLEQIVLEAVRFERRHTQEALRVAEHRASIAQAHLKQKELLRAASGDPKPSAVARARVLTEEAALLNKAFLYLELPRLAEARLEASAELAGLLLAVLLARRFAHAGLGGLFRRVQAASGRARRRCRPRCARARPPPLLANASTSSPTMARRTPHRRHRRRGAALGRRVGEPRRPPATRPPRPW